MPSSKATYGKVDASMRMFGMPHQLLEHNDPRLSQTTDLGKTFAEYMIIEAPIISIKPGVSEFLPGKNDDEKKAYVNQYVSAAGSSSVKSTLRKLEDEESDSLHWFDHKPAYSDYMIGVNMICKTMAVLYGVDKIKVPWVKGNTTFGYYDWRYYRLGKQYERSVSTSGSGKDGQGWAKAAMQLMSNIKSTIQNDDQYVDFYVDANASFSESASNSTTQSMLASFTDKIESMAKELSMIGAMGMGSEEFEAKITEASGDVDNLIQSTVDSLAPNGGVGGIGTLFKRLSSGAKQIIRGGNFVLPEHYSDSSYSKSYSFSMTLATPYGTKLGHFLNVGVPLAHILGLFLPVQMSANTFKSPYLLKCFSPGWFNCSLGIGDSCSISKGGDSGWAANGLPNEIKVDVSIKDLYAQMYIPQKMSDFIENSGMIEFLMVTCGVDITNQELFLSSKIWVYLLAGSISDKVTAAPFQVKNALLNRVRNKFNLLR
ncbi:MAG: hypothetical protein NC548_29740 [Lachnospiraceae bacterium]|nr:hypothetical protein [Lachnospiraceae bacterium]